MCPETFLFCNSLVTVVTMIIDPWKKWKKDQSLPTPLPLLPGPLDLYFNSVPYLTPLDRFFTLDLGLHSEEDPHPIHTRGTKKEIV